MEFIHAIQSLAVSKKIGHSDDLFVDRLNHRYTVTILILFAIVVTASQYGGTPINCWVPGHFTGNYEHYASNICWVSSTYNIPLDEDIPHSESDRKVKMLKYYQWTPFILLFQALLFYMPRMIWRSLNDKSGLDVQGMVNAIHEHQKDTSKYLDRETFLNYLTNSFDQYVSAFKQQDASPTNESNETEEEFEDDNYDLKLENHHHHQHHHHRHTNNKKNKIKLFFSNMHKFFNLLCVTKGKRYGNYLLVLFVFCRILFTINSIIQLFVLNQFLGNDYLLLGFEVINKIYNGDDWTQLKRFPRVTMCDFRIREVGIVHRYTVQCVLSINLFNEKIFIFIWFWLCIVSLFNFFDLVSWLFTLVVNTRERYTYIKKRLTALNPPNGQRRFDPDDKKIFSYFVNDYLKEDGVLALRLLSRNAHDLIVSEVVASLFNLYKLKRNEHNEAVKLHRTFKRQLNHQHDKIETINSDEEVNNESNNRERFADIKLSTSVQMNKQQQQIPQGS